MGEEHERIPTCRAKSSLLPTKVKVYYMVKDLAEMFSFCDSDEGLANIDRLYPIWISGNKMFRRYLPRPASWSRYDSGAVLEGAFAEMLKGILYLKGQASLDGDTRDEGWWQAGVGGGRRLRGALLGSGASPWAPQDRRAHAPRPSKGSYPRPQCRRRQSRWPAVLTVPCGEFPA